MYRVVLAAWLLGLLGATSVSAQEPAVLGTAPPPSSPDGQLYPVDQASTSHEEGVVDPPPWQSVWGVAGLRIIPEGPRVAPNGLVYHPSFSIDLNLNMWLWRDQGIYLFGDFSFWGERPEYGVTNGRDGGLGFSKREFDISGGAAWNYSGPWEARVSGYSMNNLNRGTDPVQPSGINDGSLLENRFYLSQEYAKLGQTGFDVARATFLSVGFFPTKEMVGNDGQTFDPGLMLRSYLIYDLGEWPVYAFGDVTFITERSFQPKLLIFDVGIAARPFHSCQQWEFRLGVQNTADLQVGNVLNLWYVSLRFIF